MKTPWTRAQIRAARQMPLEPVLEQLGYRLQPTGRENCRVMGISEQVVVKEHYWVRLDDGAAGNAIDFLVNIHGMSFNQAMRTLHGTHSPSPS